jgi:hypothetical protein
MIVDFFRNNEAKHVQEYLKCNAGAGHQEYGEVGTET